MKKPPLIIKKTALQLMVHKLLKCQRVGPVLVQLSFQFFCVWWKMFAFTQSNFPIQLFRDVLQRNTTILVLRTYAHFTASRSSSGGHFVRIFCRIERGKIKNWRLVLFSSNTLKMSETCQKLAFTHPIVVLKSGLKKNWIVWTDLEADDKVHFKNCLKELEAPFVFRGH